MRVPSRRPRGCRPAVKHAYRVPCTPVSVQIGNLIRMQQRRAVSPHLAETPVLWAEPARNGIFLQDGCYGSTQAVASQVFYPAVGPLQRGNGLLIPLRVPDEMQRNKRVIKHISYRMGSRYVQGIPVMDDRLFISVSFLEPPVVWDRIIAVIEDYWCWRRVVFSAIDRPTSLWLCCPLVKFSLRKCPHRGSNVPSSLWLGFP